MWISYVFIGLAVVVMLLLFQVIYGLIFKDGKNTRMIKAVIGSAYFARTNEFKLVNRFAKPGGIVFVGDSLTQRYPLSDFYPGLHVYNRGIDGDTTVGLSKRLDLSIFDLKPTLLVLQIGTNDLQVQGLSKEQTVANMQAIIKTIQEKMPSLKVLLVSLYLVNQTTDKLVNRIIVGPRKNQDLQWMNSQYQQIAGITFVNVYPELLDEHGDLNMQYSKEGLHLSLAGYAKITPVIQAAIAKVLG
ncbi:MAG: GDSL-type esterase/lipase family protein [Bacilli bacterium]